MIIPTWNRADTIGRAVRSVLGQTYPHLEVLICDDGSTDGTREVIDPLNDGRIIWLPGERSGRPAPPRNRGIAAAGGEWLAFLDSDDEWMPRKIEMQLLAMERQRTYAAASNALRIVPGQKPEPFLFWNKNTIFFSNLAVGNLVVSSSAIIHKSLIADTGGFPEEPEMKAVEDYALWLRVATFTNFSFIREMVVNYYDQPAQSVRKDDQGFFGRKKLVFQNYRRWAKSTNHAWELQTLSNWKIQAFPNFYSMAVNAYKIFRRGR